MLRWMQNENSFTQVMDAIAHLSHQFQDGLAKVDARVGDLVQQLGATNENLDAMGHRLDAMDRRLDAGIAALNQRIDASIETWSSLMWEGFEAIGKRFDRLEETVRALTERVDRMEYAIYEIQHWLEDHNKETHVVHRVIDSLNARLMAMEDFLGFPRPNPES